MMVIFNKLCFLFFRIKEKPLENYITPQFTSNVFHHAENTWLLVITTVTLLCSGCMHFYCFSTAMFGFVRCGNFLSELQRHLYLL